MSSCPHAIRYLCFQQFPDEEILDDDGTFKFLDASPEFPCDCTRNIMEGRGPAPVYDISILDILNQTGQGG